VITEESPQAIDAVESASGPWIDISKSPLDFRIRAEQEQPADSVSALLMDGRSPLAPTTTAGRLPHLVLVLFVLTLAWGSVPIVVERP
jgi:hypothetical protein